MPRRHPPGRTELLFGEEWRSQDQQLFEDSLTRRSAAKPQSRRANRRRPAQPTTLRGGYEQDTLFSPANLTPSQGADHEPLRPDGPKALGAVAAEPVLPDRGSGQLLLGPGRQAAQQIDQLSLQLAGDDQPGEGYLGKAGRLGRARHQAEEIVLADMILLEPEPEMTDEDDPPIPPTNKGHPPAPKT
jgi:hypothetical protein